MYAKGVAIRKISELIEGIYGFEVSEGMVLNSNCFYRGGTLFCEVTIAKSKWPVGSK